MALEKEFQAFKQKLPELLRTMKGKFILIHGDEVVSSWDDENAAYTAGCQKFGIDPFLVMLVVENEEAVRLFQDVRSFNAHPEQSR